MNKKAIIAYDVTMFIIKLFLLATIISFVAFTIFLLVVNDISSENLRSQIFVERLLASTDCLAYHNEDIDRYYPNILDGDKLSKNPLELQKELEACIDYGERVLVAAKINLRYLDKTADEQPIFYNKDEYDKWEPLTFDEKYYLKTTKQRYVLVKDNSGLKRARLQLEIITPTG